MHPYLFGVPLYFVMWGCAIAAGVGGSTVAARRAGFSTRRSVAALLMISLVIMAGSKLLYLAEAHWFPLDDYVPLQVRGAFHGFRIPGGILLFAATMPLICGALGLPRRRFGDLAVTGVATALVFVRAGCFLNGCCFGRASSLPWAITFPRQSWVFWYHRSHGWVPAGAQHSLPVHPLQLYFLVAALLMLGVLLWQRRRAWREGQTQMLFYALFFASTALLEPLRENFLTLNNWLAPAAAAISAILLAGRGLAVRAPRMVRA
jgi:phosphatidylglycerol:prolipoprotein diacylglycerol transferase